jgi:hypothetical protein
MDAGTVDAVPHESEERGWGVLEDDLIAVADDYRDRDGNDRLGIPWDASKEDRRAAAP